ncbi:allantoinase AllB [Marisediminicola sp. LYQ134]|uniref:allantoinase AllB n=1 Tax=Marisediminicola sp. LYQ134 TaxID=3391061 RepID=UPI003982F9B6
MSAPLDLLVHATSALVDGVFRPATISVRDGVIVDVEPLHDGTGEWIDAAEIVTLDADTVLVPGLVDSHVHVNEPGRTEWEGFASATRAAASGGVTTIVDMPLNSIPATVDVDALDTKQDVARPQSFVDVGFWGGAIPASLGSLAPLHDRGVFGFKAFLAPSGVDEFPHLDSAGLDEALAEVAALGSVLIVHAEDPDELARHEKHGGRDYRAFEASRPDSVETVAIDRVIAGVRRTGARAHILHLSSAAALPALAAARADGLPITVETCPHYLCLTAEEIPDGATQFKCCPPIRDSANRDALWQGLTDGVIDIIVSDHSPSTRELKFAHDGDFGVAWGGIAGLQVGLTAVWAEAHRRGISLESVVEWMSRGPADFLGLPAKGRIAVGADADLSVFVPTWASTVDATRLEHKNAVSAFDGAGVLGRVDDVWLRGRRIDIDGLPSGALLERPAS